MGQSTLETYSLFADDFPVSSGTLGYRRSNVIGRLQGGVISCHFTTTTRILLFSLSLKFAYLSEV